MMHAHWYMLLGGALMLWPDLYRFATEHLHLGLVLRKSYMPEPNTPSDMTALLEKVDVKTP